MFFKVSDNLDDREMIKIQNLYVIVPKDYKIARTSVWVAIVQSNP